MPGGVCLLLKHMHFLSFSPIHLIAFGLLLFSSADSVLSKSKVAVQKSFNCIALEKLQSEKPRSHGKKIYIYTYHYRAIYRPGNEFPFSQCTCSAVIFPNASLRLELGCDAGREGAQPSHLSQPVSRQPLMLLGN